MTIETLNNNVILVELSDVEMKTYNITFESLSNQDVNTHIAIRKLLDRIDDSKLAKDGGKVIVETLPIDGGGCFFIFTFTQIRKKYKLKKREVNNFFFLENLDNFLDLICTARKTPDEKSVLTAFQMGKEYYISIPKENIRMNMLLEEFGTNVDKTTTDRVLEYGKKIGKIYLQ